ncbi:MAG: succinate dehydrogenase, cytochrome b556 subunit [Alphaproteobacteria bacterium]|nr:succinate dehydrogenase, cytochrome b556 subunit [Alphaproteobacteria bacterium]
MADTPHAGARRPRPLSPHFTIYHWPITMAASITHRLTGIALSLGTILVAWWLVAASSGPESGSFQLFATVVSTPLGQLVLFGFVWSLAFHFFNGLRHLGWDLGFGFQVQTAKGLSFAIYALSLVVAMAAFALVYFGHAGYLQ